MLNAYEKHLKIKPSKIPDDYSINLMWLNRTLDETKPFIDSSQTEADLIEKVLSWGKKWKENNPDAEVAIWYDSEFVTPEALKNTQAVLDKLKLAQQDGSYHIKLKDIRDIDIVKNNPDAFSDFIPIYYRVDLMKLIICVNEIEVNSKQAAIFTDMDVGEKRKAEGKLTERMTKEELFKPEIMERLNAIGMQLILDINNANIENQFIQVMNKPETINAMKVSINANLSCASTALNVTNDERKRNIIITNLGNVVFNRMKEQLFYLIIGLINQDILLKANLFDANLPDEWIKYDLKTHGCVPLGNLFFERGSLFVVIPEGVDYANKPDFDSKNVRNFIELPALRPNLEWSRNDLDTRRGNSHTSSIDELVPRKPADGSEIYKCKHLELGEKPINDTENKTRMKI